MKKLLALITLCVVFNSCTSDDRTINEFKTLDLEDDSFDIILIAGQSNTHSGLGLDKSIDTPHDSVYQLGRFGDNDLKLIGAIEPLDHHTKGDAKIGFGLTFAKELVNSKLSKNKVLLVPCGYGGSSFRANQWNKGDYLYEDAVMRVNYLLKKNSNNRLLAVLWHQGESDVGQSNFQGNLDHFIEDIREDLGDKELPFILGGMVPYWVNKNQKRIDQQLILQNTRLRIKNVGYVDPNLPFVIEKNNNEVDEIHYDASGQRELGRRYYQEYVNLIN